LRTKTGRDSLAGAHALNGVLTGVARGNLFVDKPIAVLVIAVTNFFLWRRSGAGRPAKLAVAGLDTEAGTKGVGELTGSLRAGCRRIAAARARHRDATLEATCSCFTDITVCTKTIGSTWWQADRLVVDDLADAVVAIVIYVARLARHIGRQSALEVVDLNVAFITRGDDADRRQSTSTASTHAIFDLL
jgi:hypothetical protein